jgi:hypothetical protein
VSDRIKQLIAADKLERAIEELISQVGGRSKEITNQLVQFQASLAKNKKDFRRGLITSEQENLTLSRIRFAVLDMMEEIGKITDLQGEGSNRGPHDGFAKSALPTVFISYNHDDSEVAYKLKQALEDKGVVVRIDQTAMRAGADIQEFIENSIRDTDVTLLIVSNRSLLSAWVALESINTFFLEKFESGKKFIACYLDTDFFRNDFRLNATRQIDEKIKEIDELILEYIAGKIDTNDLNSQKSRLYKLRNNLGDILLRLRDSLCLDLRGQKFEESVNKIVSEIFR